MWCGGDPLPTPPDVVGFEFGPDDTWRYLRRADDGSPLPGAATGESGTVAQEGPGIERFVLTGQSLPEGPHKVRPLRYTSPDVLVLIDVDGSYYGLVAWPEPAPPST